MAEVQGLAPLLHKHSRPQVLALRAGEAARRADNVLLVDAHAVASRLTSQLASSTAAQPSASAVPPWLHQAALRFYGCLVATGLNVVVVVDGEAEAAGGASAAALATAYSQLDLAVERSAGGAARTLLLAWYHANRQSVLAVLSDDSSLYVLGVHAVAHPEEVVTGTSSVTLHLWDTTRAWIAWQTASCRPNQRGIQITLLKRAQVAAVLAHVPSAPGEEPMRPYGFCPNMAADELLACGGTALGLEFFQSEPLSIKGFEAADLARFNADTDAFMAADKAARAPDALDGAHSTVAPPQPVQALIDELNSHEAAVRAENARQASVEAASSHDAEGMRIDVGSSLSEYDWRDIDAKEVVAKVRCAAAGAAYMLVVYECVPGCVCARRRATE